MTHRLYVNKRHVYAGQTNATHCGQTWDRDNIIRGERFSPAPIDEEELREGVVEPERVCGNCKRILSAVEKRRTT